MNALFPLLRYMDVVAMKRFLKLFVFLLEFTLLLGSASAFSTTNYESIEVDFLEKKGYLFLAGIEANSQYRPYVPPAEWFSPDDENAVVISLDKANQVAEGKVRMPFNTEMELDIVAGNMCWMGDIGELTLSFIDDSGNVDGKYYYRKRSSSWTGIVYVEKNGSNVFSFSQNKGPPEFVS